MTKGHCRLNYPRNPFDFMHQTSTLDPSFLACLKVELLSEKLILVGRQISGSLCYEWSICFSLLHWQTLRPYTPLLGGSGVSWYLRHSWNATFFNPPSGKNEKHRRQDRFSSCVNPSHRTKIQRQGSPRLLLDCFTNYVLPLRASSSSWSP